jgi:hypothetical protein
MVKVLMKPEGNGPKLKLSVRVSTVLAGKLAVELNVGLDEIGGKELLLSIVSSPVISALVKRIMSEVPVDVVEDSVCVRVEVGDENDVERVESLDVSPVSWSLMLLAWKSVKSLADVSIVDNKVISVLLAGLSTLVEGIKLGRDTINVVEKADMASLNSVVEALDSICVRMKVVTEIDVERVVSVGRSATAWSPLVAWSSVG